MAVIVALSLQAGQPSGRVIFMHRTARASNVSAEIRKPRPSAPSSPARVRSFSATTSHACAKGVVNVGAIGRHVAERSAAEVLTSKPLRRRLARKRRRPSKHKLSQIDSVSGKGGRGKKSGISQAARELGQEQSVGVSIAMPMVRESRFRESIELCAHEEELTGAACLIQRRPPCPRRCIVRSSQPSPPGSRLGGGPANYWDKKNCPVCRTVPPASPKAMRVVQ